IARPSGRACRKNQDRVALERSGLVTSGLAPGPARLAARLGRLILGGHPGTGAVGGASGLDAQPGEDPGLEQPPAGDEEDELQEVAHPASPERARTSFSRTSVTSGRKRGSRAATACMGSTAVTTAVPSSASQTSTLQGSITPAPRSRPSAWWA